MADCSSVINFNKSNYYNMLETINAILWTSFMLDLSTIKYLYNKQIFTKLDYGNVSFS